MNIPEIIKNRYSVRKYSSKPVSEEILLDVADCGRMAPTGNNSQPWIFVIITDKKTLKEIASLCRYGKFIETAGAAVAVCCDTTAPTPFEDACAATENMMIAACSYGLGTCWVHSRNQVHSHAVEKLVHCPEHHELMTLFAIGYPDSNPPVRNKKGRDEVVRFNTYE